MVGQLDACPTGSAPVPHHSFVETGHEILPTVILFFLVIKEGILSVTGERMGTEYWLTLSSYKPAQEMCG